MDNRRRSRWSRLLTRLLTAGLLTLLAGQLLVAICLLTYGFVPLPSAWGNRLLAAKLPPELLLKVDSFRLHMNGSLELSAADLRTKDLRQPLFTAQSIELTFAPLQKENLRGLLSIQVHEGTLFTPSVFSPDGLHRPLFEHITFRLYPESDRQRVEDIRAKHGDIILRGALDILSSKSPVDAVDIDSVLQAFYNKAAKLTAQSAQIQNFESPTLSFNMKVLERDLQQVDLAISSAAWQQSDNRAQQVYLKSSWLLSGQTPRPLSNAYLQAQTITIPEQEIFAEDIRLSIHPDELLGLMKGDWPKLELAARRIRIGTHQLEAPLLEMDFAQLPTIDFLGATGGLDGTLKIKGTLNSQLKSGQVRARGRIDLRQILPAQIFEKIPEIEFKSNPHYDFELEIGPSLKFERAQLRAEVDKILVDEVEIDHLTAELSYTDEHFSIDHLNLLRGDQWLDLAFNLNTNTNDYRVSLLGSAIPQDYNALLPTWWEAIFRDFDFSRSDHRFGDFIIYGNTKGEAADLFFGSASVEKVAYRGLLLDTGELIVRGRGPYTELHKLRARAGEGWVRGDIAFTSRFDEIKGPLSIRLLLKAQLTLADAAQLFDGDIRDIIHQFGSRDLITADLNAAIFNEDYPDYSEQTFFDLSANSSSPVTYQGIPFNHLKLNLFGRRETTYLRDVEFGYAAGRGRAALDISTPENAEPSLRYEVTLNDVDQDQALKKLTLFNAIDKSLQNTRKTKERAGQGRIDVTLKGQGPIADPLKHLGFGRFTLRNENLGSIQLLGPLTTILETAQLNFTSLNLNQMKGDFRYENDEIFFDPLLISGNRALISSPGRMRLSDQSLEMRVSVKLLGNAGDPDSGLRKIGDLITKPLPNLLQFDLTGTLQDQKLRSLYDPRNLIPDL